MLENLTLESAHKKLINKEITSKELVESSIARIESTDEEISAFVTTNFDEAKKQAEEVDKKIQKGEEISMLAGIPCGIKDIFCTKNLRTTASSNMLKDFIPPYDCTVAEKIREKGALFMGKTNLDAWAHGTSTENSDFFNTHNPWNLDRVPGGSSGGSAASVSSSQVLWSTGSDTGGSIRQPAAMCGVTGWKPSYGLVSRSGIISMSSSLDTIGAFAKSVADVTIIASETVGKDPRDATTIDKKFPNYYQNLNIDMKGKKIGIPKEYFIEGLQPEIERKVKEAIEVYKSLGAQIVDVSLPYTKYGIAVYYIVCPAELSSNLSRYDGIRYGHKAEKFEDIYEMFAESRTEGMGSEAKRRIMIGTYALSAGYYDAYYKKAQQVRTLVVEDFTKAFNEVDVLLTPTTPHTAFKIGEKNDDPLSLYLEDVFTVSANLAGISGLSVPCGFDNENLPIGLQILGPQFGEQTIFDFGHAYQNVTDWHEKRPGI